ncbi:hypothetical protein PFJ87_11g00040 [Encephalitozoon hellem]|uniref:Uncharacterized protein n=1 Tax=Encephalitozoon hellem TaxID=27973 RepID=A0ABY8CLV0_ENCHE|nr:hypothetical protein PFJ87_02g01860 [Encephalitozoon hellem]WEL38148.1 hypothetical protein PFJ87_03g00040 [Encephalitozoon hellem]WEL38332.1 hypothetical protein PFJ87_03g01920 [Encephalitozoon hellem]WEL38533.1 hypothetical protein PFJ87_04g02090 [Encephalitozoon hellem]WEL38931.1 hypothetical protein PFJ87_07g00040 [Encephalitozoon hellem]
MDVGEELCRGSGDTSTVGRMTALWYGLREPWTALAESLAVASLVSWGRCRDESSGLIFRWKNVRDMVSERELWAVGMHDCFGCCE